MQETRYTTQQEDPAHDSWTPYFEVITAIVIFVFFGAIPGENKMMIHTEPEAAPNTTTNAQSTSKPAVSENLPSQTSLLTLRGVLTDQSFCTHLKNFVVQTSFTLNH
jgi:hypothetical protein